MAKKSAGPNPFAHLGASAANDDTAIDLPIKDRSGEPLMGKDGQVTFQIVGEYSEQYQKNSRRMTNAILKRARRDSNFDAEESDEIGAERIAGGVIGWANVTTPDGKPIPFSHENCVTLLLAPKCGFIAPQVQDAIRGHDRFFETSSTS
jgi:hypothetical protein